MDSMVKCDVCGDLKSRKNISRHSRSCKGGRVEFQQMGGMVGDEKSMEQRMASVQQDVVDPPYCPTSISLVLSSVVGEAVLALLDQHHRYTLSQLTDYLAKYYPEVPVAAREPIVISATVAARQAALLHGIVEKNVASRDARKRDFAAEAASTLSFWALGLRPEHRSGSVYAEAPQREEVMELEKGTKEDHLDLSKLPVPVEDDEEFNRLIEECAAESHRASLAVLSPISSTPGISGTIEVVASGETPLFQPVASDRSVELPPRSVFSAAAAGVVGTTTSVTQVGPAVVSSANVSLVSASSGDVALEIYAPSDSGLDADLVSVSGTEVTTVPVSKGGDQSCEVAPKSAVVSDRPRSGIPKPLTEPVRPRVVVPRPVVEPGRSRAGPWSRGSRNRGSSSPPPRSRSPRGHREHSTSRGHRHEDNKITLTVEQYHDLVRRRRQ